jgi:lysozyme
MELNQATMELIESFEGWSPVWYPDPAHGWKVPTLGFGHTDAAGEPKYAATKNKTYTKAEGREILRRDLKKYADAISSQVKVPLNANQYGALVSWCYNVGPGNTGKSTLIKKLNAGDYKAVPSELAKWNKAGGKVLAGLTRRRKAEGDLFQTPWVGGAQPAAAPPKPVPGPQSGPAEPAPPGWLAKILSAIFGSK